MSYTYEPHWRQYQHFRYPHIKKTFLEWLLEPNSLTVRLKKHCKNFKVEIINQSWQPIFLSEQQQLNIRPHQWAKVREVKLLCDDLPWVFARTVIPRTTLTGKERELLKIGNKSLGHLLFNHPNMTRSHFEIAEIKPSHHLVQKGWIDLKSETHRLYGRRSKFYLSGKPLLVSEIFTQHFPFY